MYVIDIGLYTILTYYNHDIYFLKNKRGISMTSENVINALNVTFKKK